MTERWRYVGSQAAFELLDRCKPRERRRLLETLTRLTADPYRRPQGFGADEAGRSLSLISLNGFEIVYWLDHFVKEVRLVEIRRV